jgi:hypothetical protein
VGLSIGFLLLLSAMVLSTGRESSTRRVASDRPSPAPPPRFDPEPSLPVPPREDPRVGSPARPLPSGAEAEKAARAAFQEAREFERFHPDDLEGQIAHYEQASWDARGLSLAQEVASALDRARKRYQDRPAVAIGTLDLELRGMLAEERFPEAKRRLDAARTERPEVEWRSLIDERLGTLRTTMEVAYPRWKRQALEALGRGDSRGAQTLRDRVAGWGVDDWTKDLDRALAVPATPPSARTPEADLFRRGWERAMMLAAVRDYAEAIREMEGVSSKLGDAALRKEAASDLENFRLATQVESEALQVLARTPRTEKRRLGYWDPSGSPREIEASVVKIEPGRVELRLEKESLVVSPGELLPETLVDLWKSRPNRKPESDARLLALFLLWEGRLEAALPSRREPAANLPGKYWEWAESQRAAPSLPDGESKARDIFYAAQRDHALPATRAQAAQAWKMLLRDLPETRFVKRNRTTIQDRIRLAQEFLFTSDAMTGAGSFKMGPSKAGLAWISDADSDPSQRRNNFVEVEWSATPETDYRCFAYVGGCCAETFVFSVQGSDMVGVAADARSALQAEPGSDGSIPVKHLLGSGTRTHAGHGGKKQPSSWGWVEIALPRTSALGPKKLRFLTDRQGFAIAAVVVSASRKGPPGDAETREFEKARTPRTSAGLLTLSLEPAASGYDLTALGSLDWVHWGRSGGWVGSDRKAAPSGLISGLSETGAGAVSGVFSAPTRSVTWTDGTPSAIGASDHAYSWSNGALNSGFTFTVEAGTTARTLMIYCGASTASVTVSASLSDGSAPATLATFKGPGSYLATLRFKAGSPKQTIKITLLKTGNNPGFTDGSVDLISAMVR